MGKGITEKTSLDAITGLEKLDFATSGAGIFFTGSDCKTNTPSLVSTINYIEKINPYAGYNFGILQIEENLRNEKLRRIIYELAKAVDSNSDLEVKRLKAKYGNTKEFAQAKTFLDKKAKEIWNIFNNRKIKLQLPQKAMKALGISNQPSLDFIFEDSLKYFEKENSTTTVDIIKSVLSNINANYTFEDILKYLKTQHEKCRFEYNPNTVKFLATSLKFDKHALNNLGISRKQINNIFKTLTPIEKIKCLIFYHLNFTRKS